MGSATRALLTPPCFVRKCLSQLHRRIRAGADGFIRAQPRIPRLQQVLPSRSLMYSCGATGFYIDVERSDGYTFLDRLDSRQEFRFPDLGDEPRLVSQVLTRYVISQTAKTRDKRALVRCFLESPQSELVGECL